MPNCKFRGFRNPASNSNLFNVFGLFVSFCVAAAVSEIDNKVVENPTGTSNINVEIRPRGARQNFHIIQPNWHSYFENENFATIIKAEDAAASSGSRPMDCVLKTGVEGKCMSFEECYPLRVINPGYSNYSEFNTEENLDEDIRENSQNKNCSSVIKAGTGVDRKSKFPTICCPNTVTEADTKHHYVFSSDMAHEHQPLERKAVCGQSFVAPTQIINGAETNPGEFPWMVVIFGKSGKQICGGTLLNENVILTAAHCIHTYTAPDVRRMKVFIGDWNIRSTLDGHHEVRKIKRIIKHKYFNIKTFVNDIAMLRMSEPVKFTKRIQPICLPSDTRSHVNEELDVAGWGRTSFSGPPSPKLRSVKVRVISNSKCGSVYKGIAPVGILQSMICAGDNGFDSCIGDSGGPLMQKIGNRYEQIGIVSFGKGCGTYPGVYTRVSKFLHWIRANINK